MALNIKDSETDRLVRELAELTGESITVATRTAVEERLESLRRRKRPVSGLRGIIERGRMREIIDARSSEDIIGYGADGLPE